VLAEEVAKEAKSPWTIRIDLGGSYATGNTERLGFAFRFEAKRVTEETEFLALATAIYAEDRDSRTENEQIVAFRYDRKFEDWYLFAGINFERDEFEDIDLRSQIMGGAGTWLEKSEDLTIKVETAPAATYVDYRSGNRDDEWLFEWIFALWGDWKVSEQLTIKQWIRWVPDLTNTPDYRINWLTDFITPLAENVSGKLTFAWDYNTRPAPGLERSDIRVLVSVVFQF
jgi:putative salt-induced outer membrane protein YdiY